MPQPELLPQPVPNHQPRDRVQRCLEMSIGLVPFASLAVLVVLCRYWLLGGVAVLLVYTLAWLIRVFGYSYRLMASYYYLKLSLSIDWQAKLSDVMQAGRPRPVPAKDFWSRRAEKWYRRFLGNAVAAARRLDPEKVYHALIIATSNESPDILASTLEAVRATHYDKQKIMLIIAYEGRGGAAVEREVRQLLKRYGSGFLLAVSVKHPDGLPGEARAKAGNITYAAKFLSGYCARRHIDPDCVLVTTLDADHRPHPQYLAGLAWTYCLAGDRRWRSYQPVPLFTNNIWDAPALVRVIAADTNFWYMIEAMRPERLRLFGAYAQSLKALQDTDYWNVEVVVEDGHQYWRSYFVFNGKYTALPVLLPIYQDAVISGGYWHSHVAQYRQLKRWAWSTSDTPWLLRQAWRDHSIGWPNKLVHIMRQIDDYMTWSTAPIILAVGGWLPLWLSPHPTASIMAYRLPYIIGALQLVAFVGLVTPALASLLTLPPRPPHQHRRKLVAMVLQWLLEPVALLAFITPASLSAHLRLIFNRPLETFYVTTKTRRPPTTKANR